MFFNVLLIVHHVIQCALYRYYYVDMVFKQRPLLGGDTPDEKRETNGSWWYFWATAYLQGQ